MEDYKLSVVAGGKPLPNGALFAQDGRHFVVPFSNQLRVYFITTRQCVRSLKFNDVNKLDFAQLVALRQDIADANLVWAFLGDGQVLVINWKEKMVDPVVKRYTLNKSKDDSVLKIVSFKQDSFIAITGKNSDKPHTRHIVQYSVHKTDIEASTLSSIKNVILFNESKDHSKIVFLSKNNGGKAFNIVDLMNTEQKHVVPFAYKAFITSLAISNDSTISAGTSSGVIHLLYENTSRILKWHIDQVKSLSFSQDSKYLLSGGLERVLVFWQLDTEKQQFLPRLNGEIAAIETQTPEYYNITLKLDNQENYEILVLSAVDLQSRLLVSGPRQKLNSDLSNMKKLIKSFQKTPGHDITKLKYDFSSTFQIHPTSKNLYFINDSNLQAFDFNKNEQSSIQKVTDSLQTGKVRSETKLLDPIVKHFTFTTDGKWMATVEEHRHGEIDNLLSKNDVTYILKIWRSVEIQARQTTATSQQTIVQSSWELITKIVNPHGFHIPIVSIIPAPTSYFDGIAFLTGDNNGGVRLWRPTSNDEKHISWSLRKLKPSSGIYSNSTSLTWSGDASLIVQGFDESIILIDPSTFEEIDTQETKVLKNIVGSNIRFTYILDNILIVLSKNSLKTINLITLKESKITIGVNTQRFGYNLIAVDPLKERFAFAVNYYDQSAQKIKAKIFIFDTGLKVLFSTTHSSYISCIQFQKSFILIDIDSKIAVLDDVLLEDQQVEDTNFQESLEMLLMASQNKLKQHADSDMDLEMNGNNTILDTNSFNDLFNNLTTSSLPSIFEKVVNVLN